MLRSYTARLNKHWKLCTKFYSPSHLQRNTPTIHHNNIRLIQSALHNTTSHSIKSPLIASHTQTYNKSYFNPLQIFHKRSFSLLWPEHEIIGLPALSPSVEESKIVAWKANEGDLVAADTVIASVQTDKAEIDWMVTDDVYLAKILLQPGDQVPVGTPACIFVDSKKDIEAFKNYSSDTIPQTQTQTQPSETADTSNYPDHKVEGMPALSPTAVDGAVVEWLVKEGDMIEEGSGIAEIQTDKSVVTWTSTDEAYVAKLLVPVAPEDKLPVGTPLAVFVENKNDVAAFQDFVVSTAPAQSTPNVEVASDSPTQPQPSIQFRHGVRDTDTDTAKTTSGGRIFASPYAKKLAKEMGIALDSIGTATGDRGRIVAVDVIKASHQKPPPTTTVTVPQPVTITGDRSYEDIPVSVMRDIIGKRLSESKFTSPHFYVTMECMMDSLIGMREEINANEENKISVNDFVIKSCAAALRDTPDCNVGWIVDGNGPGNKSVLRKYNYIDISVAVATPSGLITPIIKDADRKSLSEISFEMKSLAKKAKDNKLLPEEFQGGTFTVSNMGMFGVSNFTAIINPPQSCILAVGGTKKKLMPDSNEKGFKTVSTMEVTLSSDHRSVDGALAAIWVNAFQKYIEKPSKLMR